MSRIPIIVVLSLRRIPIIVVLSLHSYINQRKYEQLYARHLIDL